MAGKNLHQAFPFIVVVIITAGMFSVLFLPVNIEIYGTVTDADGNPLNHAYVEVYTTGGLRIADGVVDSHGNYSLSIHHYGEFEVWAWMPPSTHYWAQFQKVKFEPQNKNIRHEADFQLIREIPCNVTLIASYWSVNSTHTSIHFGFTQRGTITTVVAGWDRGDPYNSAVSIESYGTIAGSGSSEGGRFGYFEQRSISGSYSVPGEAASIFVYEDANSTGTYGPVPHRDYMIANNASEGWNEVVEPANWREARIDVCGNYTLPDALSIAIDVDILGKRLQTTLPCTILDPGQSTLSIWVGVTNLDSVPHSYKFFIEGGHIIHVWEIS